MILYVLEFVCVPAKLYIRSSTTAVATYVLSLKAAAGYGPPPKPPLPPPLPPRPQLLTDPSHQEQADPAPAISLIIDRTTPNNNNNNNNNNSNNKQQSATMYVSLVCV